MHHVVTLDIAGSRPTASLGRNGKREATNAAREVTRRQSDVPAGQVTASGDVAFVWVSGACRPHARDVHRRTAVAEYNPSPMHPETGDMAHLNVLPLGCSLCGIRAHAIQ